MPVPRRWNRKGLWATAGLAIFMVLVIVVGLIAASGNDVSALPPGTDFLLPNGQILDVGNDGTFSAVDPEGNLVWSFTGSYSSLTRDTAPYAVPQLSDNCVTVFKDSVHAEVVPADSRTGTYSTLTGAGYATVNGTQAAWVRQL